MSNTAQAACFCMGKAPECTCGGRCRCACTCAIDKMKIFEPIVFETTFEDFIEDIDTTDKRKKLNLPPNCS